MFLLIIIGVDKKSRHGFAACSFQGFGCMGLREQKSETEGFDFFVLLYCTFRE
jgi:hypothetical protein